MTTIDEEQIGSLAEVAGVDVVNSILDAFWQSTENLTADLNQAIAVRDVRRIAELGHALKGSSANIGAAQMAKRAKLIEDAARAGEVESVMTAMRDITTDIAATRSALTEMMKRYAA